MISRTNVTRSIVSDTRGDAPLPLVIVHFPSAIDARYGNSSPWSVTTHWTSAATPSAFSGRKCSCIVWNVRSRDSFTPTARNPSRTCSSVAPFRASAICSSGMSSRLISAICLSFVVAPCARACEEHRSEQIVSPPQLLGGAGESDLPALEEICPVRNAQCQVDVLVDQHDGYAVAVQARDDLEQLFHDLGRKAQRKLVDEQELRLDDERLRQCEHLLLSPRQAAGDLPAPVGQQWEELEHRFDPRSQPLGVAPEREARHLQVLLHG